MACGLLFEEEGLDDEEREGENGEEEPEVEVESEVAVVVVPGFGAEDVGPTGFVAENIVENNSPGDDY